MSVRSQSRNNGNLHSSSLSLAKQMQPCRTSSACTILQGKCAASDAVILERPLRQLSLLALTGRLPSHSSRMSPPQDTPGCQAPTPCTYHLGEAHNQLASSYHFHAHISQITIPENGSLRWHMTRDHAISSNLWTTLLVSRGRNLFHRFHHFYLAISYLKLSVKEGASALRRQPGVQTSSWRKHQHSLPFRNADSPFQVCPGKFCSFF